ncbi:hypothetical protein BG844_10680 [Couchioplanes caeruleus subsp. caeruleus]|uniref:Uncharacterized protein n=1 Tax=Couchioplanes caeruleus subsp. caeruleus TaxID=56427 RepID=A0A1K0FN94_9ACTN|nr:hypothetical protein BG844_10680 [Couchioplanes caeruleus subsp. caeruleus]
MHGAEELVEQHRAEQRGHHRRQQAEYGDRGDRQRGDAAEPQDVGDQPAGQTEPEIAEYGVPADGRRGALHQPRHRHQEQSARGELPARVRRRADRGRASPPLGQRHSQRHRAGPGETGRDPDRVEAGVRTDHHQADAGHAHDPPGEVPGRRPLVQHRHGQGRHEQRLRGAQGGGHAAGQSAGADEQQRQEHADVEHPERGGLQPPGPPRQRAAESDRDQAGRQRPHHRREQRMVRR